MLGPDFVIVGAPKCGTTSVNAYLSQHPSVFMAAKEQHFFGADLGELWAAPIRTDRPGEEEYRSTFCEGADAPVRGEASVWYLWSSDAASEIHRFNPEAKIVAILRNPPDALYSLHSHYLYDGIEDLTDFGEALAAEEDRKAGRRIPPTNGPQPWRLFYRDVARFDEQVARYFDVFGRERVHLVWFDDLAADPTGTLRLLFEFLEVEPDFTPDLSVENANKRVRSEFLRRAVYQISDPSSQIRRMGTRVIPAQRVRSAMMRRSVPALRRLNTSVERREPLDPSVRRALIQDLTPGIRRLEALVGRDLSAWTEPASVATD